VLGRGACADKVVKDALFLLGDGLAWLEIVADSVDYTLEISHGEGSSLSCEDNESVDTRVKDAWNTGVFQDKAGCDLGKDKGSSSKVNNSLVSHCSIKGLELPGADYRSKIVGDTLHRIDPWKHSRAGMAVDKLHSQVPVGNKTGECSALHLADGYNWRRGGKGKRRVGDYWIATDLVFSAAALYVWSDGSESLSETLDVVKNVLDAAAAWLSINNYCDVDHSSICATRNCSPGLSACEGWVIACLARAKDTRID
jgi:hypothetical protein